MDTDLLLCLLQSLLPPSHGFTTQSLLQALADNEGNPKNAASDLLTPSLRPPARSPSISQWLKPNPLASTSKPIKRRRTSPTQDSPAPKKNTTELRLRPPPSIPSSSQLPPLTLATKGLLLKHLPAVVVPESPIPSELASALFLSLMEESKRWKKLTYWIGNKEVQSPHTVRLLSGFIFANRKEFCRVGQHGLRPKMESNRLASTFPINTLRPIHLPT